MDLHARSRKVAAYAYAFQRLLELEAAWLPWVRDTRFKILLGHQIGYDALALGGLCRRLGEMLAESVPAAPGPDYARSFDEHTRPRDERELAGFLVAVLRDLRLSMTAYLEAGAEVGDEPSRLLLRQVLDLLDRQIPLWEGLSSGTPALPGIDQTGGEPVRYTGREPLPPLVEFPRRAAALRFGARSVIDAPLETLLASPEGKLKILHFVYVDIEIPASEVCARNIVEYRDMPLQFKLDMARQVWDEARHARLVRDRFLELGGVEGQLTYDCNVWKRYFLGRTRAERLAIQQVVQEGNGLDAVLFLAAELRRLGDETTAEILDFLNADESIHARFGNQWLLREVNDVPADYERHIDEAARKIGVTVPGHFPPDPYARALAGYPPWFVERLQDDFERRSRPA